jgi:hypothetical protein
MDAPHDAFRELFFRLRRKHDLPLYWHVLAPWVQSHSAERDWLDVFARRQGDPIPPASMLDLWALYALSRVYDALLLNFQPGAATEGWPEGISHQEYTLFAESLGLKCVEQLTFSPFHHEIVTVDESPNESQPVTLEEILWPALMLGDMMFSRAGVRVSGGRRFISKQVAESSTLYWTFHRKSRPCAEAFAPGSLRSSASPSRSSSACSGRSSSSPSTPSGQVST